MCLCRCNIFPTSFNIFHPCYIQVIIIHNIYIRHCFRCEKNFKARYGKDSWVCITGASDGIGKGFVEGWAKRGFNIILISRTKSKLDSLANEVESKYKVKTKTIAADFTKAMESGF